ncbi:MAG: YitT family protein [Collinsella sp.]
MAYRLDIKRILSLNFFHDLPKIMLGCALAAIATDLFLIPNGLAAGGIAGLATIIRRSVRLMASRCLSVSRPS